jgi:tetratricopeptide (TPR) repeat protein
LPDLLKAGELDEQLFAAHHIAALCFYNLKRYAEAEAAANRAIALAPEMGEAWFFRGIARYAAGRTKEALQDIRRAVELDPSDKRASEFKT